MTKTVLISLTATLNGEDAPTVAEQEALLLRLIHSTGELLDEKYGIGLTYDVGSAAAPLPSKQQAQPDGGGGGKARSPRLTAERVREFVEAPEGWTKASVGAGYTPAGIRQAADRFNIELPGVRKRAPIDNGVDHHAASSAP